jgi:hypothetical protein
MAEGETTAWAGTTAGSVKFSVHRLPSHQRVRPLPAGSGYQPAAGPDRASLMKPPRVVAEV